MYSKDELEKQEREIRKKLTLAAIPILIIVTIIVVWKDNSLDVTKKEYLKKRMKGYSGIIIKKYEEGDYPRARRYVILDNYTKVDIHDYLYNKLSIGDSVIKKSNSDSIYFYLKDGDVQILDELKWWREKYYELKNKNN